MRLPSLVSLRVPHLPIQAAKHVDLLPNIMPHEGLALSFTFRSDRFRSEPRVAKGSCLSGPILLQQICGIGLPGLSEQKYLRPSEVIRQPGLRKRWARRSSSPKAAAPNSKRQHSIQVAESQMSGQAEKALPDSLR